jgi:hypothetical protein
MKRLERPIIDSHLPISPGFRTPAYMLSATEVLNSLEELAQER